MDCNCSVFLLERRTDIPIVFVTACDDVGAGLQTSALHAGALAFLHKPVMARELMNCVCQAFIAQRERLSHRNGKRSGDD